MEMFPAVIALALITVVFFAPWIALFVWLWRRRGTRESRNAFYEVPETNTLLLQAGHKTRRVYYKSRWPF